MSRRKLLILDTSVLLYDKESIHSFPGNDIVLPLIVLDELDRFKEKTGLLGEAARYVNRFLDDLRSKGRLYEGVLLEDIDQSIRVMSSSPKLNAKDQLDPTRGDNMIIAAALDCKNKTPNEIIKVITKDINLRVKCDAVGLFAEDYYRDYLDADEETFSGVSELSVNDNLIDQLYEEGSFDWHEEIYENSYVVCKGNGQGKSALGVYKKRQIFLLNDSSELSETDVRPRNKEQKFALHALKSPDVPLVSLTGLAGSGKTFLALMAGIDALTSKKYERIIVTRNIQPVGRDLGYLPGDINEKMSPWMSPLLDNFRHHFKDKIYFELMIEKGEIEIAPLSYIRGRTFNDSYLIVDEAQNANNP